MILGVGVDILDCRRIQKLFLNFPERFVRKVFTKTERMLFEKRNFDIATIAKIFAIKEGVIKAISDISGASWHDIEVLHDEIGKPFVKLRNVALAKAEKKSLGGEFKFEVSVSDELPYVCAFVVFEAL